MAESVSVGREHTCFVSADPAADGELYCMGTNVSIQGGRHPAAPPAPPQAVELRGGVDRHPPFVSVHSRFDHSCAIDINGSVWCWGFNTSGQTGNVISRFAVPIESLGIALDVAVSGQATCVLLAAGTVECFGANGLGQLGRGNTTGGGIVPAPVRATSGDANLTGVTQLTAGTDEFCAIHGASDELVCWGENLQGSISSVVGVRDRPTIVADNVSDIVHFHLGLCYIDAVGAYCRGREEEGQFGRTPTATRAAARARNELLEGITQIAGGVNGGCGLRDGEVVCWGMSAYGTIPRTSLLEEPSPVIDVDSAVITNLTHLVQSDEGSCGIRDGQAYCWGSSGRFEGGDRTNISHPTPTLVPGLDSVIDIARGDFGVCAIRGGPIHELWCWSNVHPIGNLNAPTSVPAVINPIEIDMGFRHGCAVLSAGEVSCWGQNDLGQTGSPTAAFSLPTIVERDGSTIFATAVATGFDFSCAILSGTRRVVCWGDNTYGQLGTGSTTGEPGPVLSLATNAVKIEAGYQNVCILTDGNEVQCWGRNDHGQFGESGAAPGELITFPPVAGTMAVSVATGARSTCVAYADETVRCRGDNTFGQLGMAGASSAELVLVPGVTATEVINASNHSFSNCAGLDGSWTCWGLNDIGKLGTDAMLHYPPTQIER